MDWASKVGMIVTERLPKKEWVLEYETGEVQGLSLQKNRSHARKCIKVISFRF